MDRCSALGPGLQHLRCHPKTGSSALRDQTSKFLSTAVLRKRPFRSLCGKLSFVAACPPRSSPSLTWSGRRWPQAHACRWSSSTVGASGFALWLLQALFSEVHGQLVRVRSQARSGPQGRVVANQFRRIKRVAARGPPQQASALPFLRFTELRDPVAPLVPNGRCDPRRLLVNSSLMDAQGSPAVTLREGEERCIHSATSKNGGHHFEDQVGEQCVVVLVWNKESAIRKRHECKKRCYDMRS